MSPARESLARRRIIDGKPPIRGLLARRRAPLPAIVDPASLRLRRPLVEGGSLELRAIAPSDRTALREELFLKLSSDSLRNRFFCNRLDLTEAELTRLCEVDFCRHVAVVAEIVMDGRRRLVGIGRLARADCNSVSAEIAITVQDAYQGRGIGALLLRQLIVGARRLGLERLEGSMFDHNRRMARLMRETGLPCRSRSEDGFLTLWLDLAAAGSDTDPKRALPGAAPAAGGRQPAAPRFDQR